MKKSIILSFVIIFGSCFSLKSQNFTVKAHIDSTMMWIGNQTNLSFEISQRPNQKIITPIFSDTIIGGLEIVNPLKVDTIKSEDGHWTIKQNYTVTSFEDSLLYIPSYPFVENGDTLWTQSLSLKVVQPFQVDTASHQIADIKPVLSAPFNWKAFFKVLLIVLLLLLLVLALIVVIRKFIKKKPVSEFVAPEMLLPPFEVAVAKLNEIKNEKMWQHNRTKEYYTAITDVLREYIERSFDIHSMEMTSDEILENLNHLRFESKQSYDVLQQVLKLADLVKFAKWKPLMEEHELSLNNSYLFVELTKPQPVVEENTAPDAE